MEPAGVAATSPSQRTWPTSLPPSRYASSATRQCGRRISETSLSASGGSASMLASSPGIDITSNSAPKARGEAQVQLLALGRGEEADGAEVDREHRHVRVGEVAHRLQDRAVAAEHQAEVGPAVEVGERLDPGRGVAVLGELAGRRVEPAAVRLRPPQAPCRPPRWSAPAGCARAAPRCGSPPASPRSRLDRRDRRLDVSEPAIAPGADERLAIALRPR